jgi:anti-sigma factor ChrR (cupin superfamily)
MSDLFFPDLFRDGFTMDELPWVPWVEPGRAGVEHCVLWAPAEDEPSVALLLRFPPGAHGDFHEHLGHELMLVLDGQLDHSDGRSFGRGDLVVEQPGSRHQMSSARGCTVLAIRTKPARPRRPRAGEITVRPASVASATR